MDGNVLNIQTVLGRLMGSMSESALARAIEVPKATINRIISGRTPDPRISTLTPIAEYFNVSIEQLLGLQPLPNNSELSHIDNRKNAMSIPVIPTDKLTSNHVNAENHYPIIHGSKLQNRLTEDCYATFVTSPAMEPKFHENTIIIINPELEAKHNDYILTCMDGKGILFRQLIVDGKDRYLSALNAKFDLINLSEQWKILGVVVESRTKL